MGCKPTSARRILLRFQTNGPGEWPGPLIVSSISGCLLMLRFQRYALGSTLTGQVQWWMGCMGVPHRTGSYFFSILYASAFLSINVLISCSREMSLADQRFFSSLSFRSLSLTARTRSICFTNAAASLPLTFE